MNLQNRGLLQSGAPWTTFRQTMRDSGRWPVQAAYHDDKRWFFQTGKGIFSTPVIDADGIVYFGSADHNFYALTPDGREKWRFRTGEIIDSAGALPADYPGTVLVPSTGADAWSTAAFGKDGRI